MAGKNPNPTAQDRREFPWGTVAAIAAAMALLLAIVFISGFGILDGAFDGPSPMTMSEISHLNQAVELFKQKYGMYPPSKIFLANTQADYEVAAREGDKATAALIQNSLMMLQRVFPKLVLVGAGEPLDWTGGRVPDFKGAVLEGDQCLVFFLGGIQTSNQGVNECIGFAANGRNPTKTERPRFDPLYEFPSTRLVVPQGPGRSKFFVYLDGYRTGKPYAYFSSYGSRNGYQDPDCAAQGIAPYFEAMNPKRYWNPNTFQIISAGADGDFGKGGLWNPGPVPVDAATRDNHANFNHGGLMAARH